jgi:hypothetical protein
MTLFLTQFPQSFKWISYARKVIYKFNCTTHYISIVLVVFDFGFRSAVTRRVRLPHTLYQCISH